MSFLLLFLNHFIMSYKLRSFKISEVFNVSFSSIYFIRLSISNESVCLFVLSMFFRKSNSLYLNLWSSWNFITKIFLLLYIFYYFNGFLLLIRSLLRIWKRLSNYNSYNYFFNYFYGLKLDSLILLLSKKSKSLSIS